MITGKVTTDREATIEIEVSGTDPSPQQIEAVIDTGFNGYLTLPSRLIDHPHDLGVIHSAIQMLRLSCNVRTQISM